MANIVRKMREIKQALSAIKHDRKEIERYNADEARFIETGELTDDLLPEVNDRYVNKCIKEADAEHIKTAELCYLAEVTEALVPKGWVIRNVSKTQGRVTATISKDIDPLDKKFVREAATDSFNDSVAARIALWERNDSLNWSMGAIWQELGRPDWANAPHFSYVGERLADRVVVYRRKWPRHSETPADVAHRPP